jgi:hypothetical protein
MRGFMARRAVRAVLALAATCLSVSAVAVTASAASAVPAASAGAPCAAVKYAHVIVLTAGDVKLTSKIDTVTGQYGASHPGGPGYSGYYLPAGAHHTLEFAASPRVCLTAKATSTAVSVSSLGALKTAVDQGPYRFYGIAFDKAGSIARIDQIPALAIGGEWEGTYTCSQGRTGLDLRIEASASGKLTAFFDFYPVIANPGVPIGSYTMTGSYDAQGVLLTPGKWLVAPPGYVTVGLSGATPGVKGVNTFRGSISDSGCTTFLLHRLSAAPAEAAAAGKWKGTYVCSQGSTGLTLTVRAGKTVDTTMHPLTATFDFYAVPGNPGVPSGSYSMTGYYFPGGIDLEPNQWISQPPGYTMVAINAVPPPAGGKTLKGAVPACNSCFALKKS